jgi:hypothetical protein
VNPEPKGRRAGKDQPREIFSIGKKKGHATTERMVALSPGSVKMNYK